MSGIRRIASPLPLPFSRATMAGGFLFLSGQIPYDAQGEVAAWLHPGPDPRCV
jgi:enamine deaminase RidA (YjgF/YER057c/UK114 family)